MHPAHDIHLPTEIVVLIVSFAAADENDDCRQRTMYACCGISRQWYSAAVALLYERPRLGRGMAFKNFTNTVCPPIAARKSKLNLGSLVRRLDLSSLVHHSTNSLTARLLGRVKENLEVFIAPRVSFAVNCLPALAKCHNLRHLDLSLVADPLPFPSLKKSLNSLSKLLALRLPRSTSLTESQQSPAIAWPPHLQRLQLSGHFSSSLISSFAWPASLASLTLKNCTDLSVNSLGCLMSSPQLSRRLTRLTISGSNRNLQPESINAIPAFLPGLTFLSIPGDLVEEPFFEMLSYMTPPLALEVLEFGNPHSEAVTRFSTVSLVKSLETGLANLRAVGFAEAYLTGQRIVEDEEIDNALQGRVKDNKGLIQRPGDDNDHDDIDDDPDVGVYYL